MDNRAFDSQFPMDSHVRSHLLDMAVRMSAELQSADVSRREVLEGLARTALTCCELPESFLGFTMVVLGNRARRNAFEAIPFERRLLLLPAGAADFEGTPFAAVSRRAGQLGYLVLSADARQELATALLESRVDAILGMADLSDLERAFDHPLFNAVPSCAVPLPSRVDQIPAVLADPWIHQVLETWTGRSESITDRHQSAIQAVHRLFRDDFDRLLPRNHAVTTSDSPSPLALTESVACDWLAHGGKRFRPFITLAAYDAARNDRNASEVEADTVVFSDSVCRVAMAIEAFHKASLIHDDIQDDDLFRYGRDTLHRSHGLGPAINIGDYLIGLGYRLVNSCRHDLGAEVACDISDSMSLAHLHLCDGQGAEMAWRDHPDWTLTTSAAVRMYALKTSPAFEAALYAGLRMAGPVGQYEGLIATFCRALGVGFQIVNDLQDWIGDNDNKLVAGQDAQSLRPTVLLALALQQASEAQRLEIRSIYESNADDQGRLEHLKQLFSRLGAFSSARELAIASRQEAQAQADQVEPPRLQALFQFLLDTVLPADQIDSLTEMVDSFETPAAEVTN